MSEKELANWKHYWNLEAVKIENALEILKELDIRLDKDAANLEGVRVSYIRGISKRLWKCLVPEPTGDKENV